MAPPSMTPQQIQDLMEFYGDPQSEYGAVSRPFDASGGRGFGDFGLVIPPGPVAPPPTRPASDVISAGEQQVLTPGGAIDTDNGSGALARQIIQARQARAAGAAVPPPPPPPPPAPEVRAGDIAQQRVAIGTGSQGGTTPSNAGDVASVGTRISRYLEQAVGRLAGEQQGFGDIANALMQVRASGGRVNFEQAMRDIEAKDFNRATNLANAYAALKRADGSGQLSLKDQALIEQRRLDRAAREGNQAAMQLNAAINSAVKDYARADQPRVREEIMTTIAAWRLANEGREATPSQVPDIMREVLGQVNRRGFRRGGGEGGAAGPSGGGIYMEGSEQRFAPFVPQGRGGLSQQQQAANRAFERGDEQAALQIARNIESRAAGGGGRGGGGGAERELGKFREQLAAARTTIDLMDDIKAQIDRRGTSIMGAAGSLSSIFNGLAAQSQAILGINDIRERTRNAAVSFNQELLKSPETRRAFAWLEGDNSAEATAFRSNMLILGTSLAKALDPGGRLSNQDVQQALAIIGQQGRGILTNASDTKAALESVERYLNSVMRQRRIASPDLMSAYPEDVPLRMPRGGAPSGGAAGGGALPDEAARARLDALRQQQGGSR